MLRLNLRQLVRRGIRPAHSEAYLFPSRSSYAQQHDNRIRYFTALHTKGARSFPSSMDIDTVTKELKDVFGDKETWSYDKLHNLTYDETIFTVHDVQRFLDYAVGGYRPDGGRPSFSLMTQEEMALIDAPYHQWAPAPFSNLGHSCLEKAQPVFMDMGDENLVPPPFATFYARLKPLRAKIRNGMVPISHDRWMEKRMDDPDNYKVLVELMSDVVEIFSWLNDDDTLHRTRHAFNYLVDTCSEFGEALNRRREERGVQERLDLAGMWAEFHQAQISTSTNRTHQWLVERVGEVQSRALERYHETVGSAGNDQEALIAAGKRFYGCIQELNSVMMQVHFALGIPISGLKGYESSGRVSDFSIVERVTRYKEMTRTKPWRTLEQIAGREKLESTDQKSVQTDDVFQDPQALVVYYHDLNNNMVELRKAFRGEPKALGEEDWITILKERMEFYLQNGRDRATHRWGFVCYRLTYKQTDEEWRNFLTKLEADIFRSGRWIAGYDAIADMAGLDYIDGRDHGIAEGDIEAAKRHFTSIYTMLATPGRWWTKDFLAIDYQSYESYANPVPAEDGAPCAGDQGGFVRLVDTITYDQQFLDAVSPDYKGQVKVLSTLVLEDVYPLLSNFSVRPSGLWPLARLHPMDVYVGHTVPTQEAWWEMQRVEMGALMGAFIRSLKKE